MEVLLSLAVILGVFGGIPLLLPHLFRLMTESQSEKILRKAEERRRLINAIQRATHTLTGKFIWAKSMMGTSKDRSVNRLYRHPNVVLIVALIARGLLTKCMGWEIIFLAIPALVLLPIFMLLQAAYLEEFHRELPGHEDIWPFIFSCAFALGLFALPAFGDDATTDFRCNHHSQSIMLFFSLSAVVGFFSTVVGSLYYVVRRLSFRRKRAQP